MTGIVFSVEEFSLYDGPGIRTSVFLKGCPMRCDWCHNPEGQEFAPRYVRSPNGCLNCGKCLEAGFAACGERRLTEESRSVCPRRLIRLCGITYTPEALVNEIAPNLDLLNQAGGGVTFSGGEVLSQADFTAECLDRLQGKTHRAVQTSGYGSDEAFEMLLSRCELVLHDLKIFDGTLHRRHTGCSNESVLRHYRRLATSGVPFITRIPLIPGVTDTEANLTAIAGFMAENGVRYAELLPYNPMAGAKYTLAGKEYRPDFDPTVPWNAHPEIFAQAGISVKIM